MSGSFALRTSAEGDNMPYRGNSELSADQEDLSIRYEPTQLNHMRAILPREVQFALYDNGWEITFSGLTTAQVERLADLTKDGL